MKVECPFCKEVYNVKRSQLGKQATCNMCEQTFVLYVEGVDPLPPKKKNPNAARNVLLGLVVLLLLGGGGYGAYWYFKVYRPQQQQKSAAVENAGNEGATPAAIIQADMVNSKNNLKQIGTALAIHASEHKDSLPESLNTLMKNENLTDPKVYVAPFDKVSTVGNDKIEPENTTYAYVGSGIQIGRPIVVAFEKPWLLPEGWDQINVLMADGSVLTKTIPDAGKKSCREIVEILTAEEKDKTTVEKLLKNAEKEDEDRNSGN